MRLEMSWLGKDSVVHSSVPILLYVGKLRIKEWMIQSVLGCYTRDERVKVVH
jgi:hypothetical protein